MKASGCNIADRLPPTSVMESRDMQIVALPVIHGVVVIAAD
jgi:hypothetical protein